MSFWTYILRCSDGSYYTGHTDDLVRSVAEHHNGSIKGYTFDKRPVEFMWANEFPSRDEAFATERQIKEWNRAKKEALIQGDWEAVRLLARRGSVLRDEASPGSASPQDERKNSKPGHPEEGLSEGGGPSSPGSASPQDERRNAKPAHPEEGLSEGEGPSRRTPAIVLVRPQLGENIGKAARAMLNFGLTDLRLVAPRDGWPNPAAGPAASGADIVLEQARIFDSVAEAVADCAHIYATTVRKRGLVIPVVTPEQAAAEIRAAPERSAILFGAERSGLESQDVGIASRILTVPVNPDFSSLNLAQAVILIAYEWAKADGLSVPTESEPAEPRASQAQLDGLVGQLDAALEAAGYYHPPDRTPATKATMRTILTKPGWSNREIQALRGMLRALARPR